MKDASASRGRLGKTTSASQRLVPHCSPDRQLACQPARVRACEGSWRVADWQQRNSRHRPRGARGQSPANCC